MSGARVTGAVGVPHLSRSQSPRDTAAAVALVLLAAVPLAMVPGGYSRFVLAKLALGAAAVAAAALARPAGRIASRLWVVLGLGAVWLVVAAATSAAPWAQLVGRWPRYEGLVALPVYAGALWAGARLLGPGERRAQRTELFLRGLAVAVTVVAAVALAEAFGLRPLGGQAGRPGSFLGNASHLGSLGVLLLALGLARVARRSDAWGLVLVVGSGMAVATSGSRAALVGAVVAGVLVVALAPGGGAAGRVRRALWPTAAALVGVAAMSLLVPGVRERLVGTDELASATVSGRWLLWQDSWRLVGDHPLGVGPSGFVDAVVGVHSERWWREVGPANPPDSPHSALGQVLVAGGWPLLAIVLAAAVLVVIGARRALVAAHTEGSAPGAGSAADLVRGGLAGVAGYLVTIMVGFTSAGVTVPACFVLGAALASAAGTAPGTRARAASVGWLAVAAVWAGLLVPAALAELELARGVDAASTGRAADADAHFTAARDLRPWDSDVALLASAAFGGGAAAGDTAEAELALVWTARGLAATPDSSELALTRVRALAALGRADEARALLGILLERAPLDTDVLAVAAVLEAGAGELRAALVHLQAITVVDPDDADAWADVATLARALGDDALAAQAQEVAARLDGARP